MERIKLALQGYNFGMGIVEKRENGTIYTVVGNSGDACKQQSYHVGSSSIYGYGWPAY